MGVNVGRPIVTNGDFDALLCESDALFPNYSFFSKIQTVYLSGTGLPRLSCKKDRQTDVVVAVITYLLVCNHTVMYAVVGCRSVTIFVTAGKGSGSTNRSLPTPIKVTNGLDTTTWIASPTRFQYHYHY